LYSRKHIWSRLDYKTLPYHWDDREKYYKDYKYLTITYEHYLTLLSEQLNKLHGCDHSKRFWRILIGPWLRYFIDAVYDRYCSIKSALDYKPLSSTWIMESDIADWIPKDFNNFYDAYISDQWNHFIYGEIIKLLNNIDYEIINHHNYPPEEFNRSDDLSLLNKIKSYLITTYSSIIPKNLNSIVFISSCFANKKNLIKLQLSLGQIPYPKGPILEFSNSQTNLNLRYQIKLKSNQNEFEEILNNLIPIQIPKVYLEDFKKLKKTVFSRFPRKARGIYTANAYSHNDFFKFWAANEVQNGTKLFIGQHGGNFGTDLWAQDEDHQIKICDRYFTWGWTNKRFNHLRSLSAPRLLGMKNKLTANKNGDVVSILTSLPRYFYCSYSVPVAGQFLDYFNQQLDLTKLLSSEILSNYRIRLDQPGFEWDLKQRFLDNGLGDIIESRNGKLIDRLQKSRLCVATHNATVFLETFTANFPTILYWNPNHYEIRSEAIPYFNELNKVGILHYTPESGSKTINNIYHDTLGWWQQEEIQKAKDAFCTQFANISSNWMEEWRAELKNYV